MLKYAENCFLRVLKSLCTWLQISRPIHCLARGTVGFAQQFETQDQLNLGGTVLILLRINGDGLDSH